MGHLVGVGKLLRVENIYLVARKCQKYSMSVESKGETQGAFPTDSKRVRIGNLRNIWCKKHFIYYVFVAAILWLISIVKMTDYPRVLS